ncbi:hypothetical protein [Motilimonas pumila]|uniref:Uncharacterized protein n=1 Tax=Motilimonas pumila TaxID=2303987 RepID=A0A418Y9H0_9GAMM|nr:hypothetical protein [Motilimonas pumila]RJG37351.1 hypothetical protein D1Z90_19845 [Motilimonas pumila]
MQKNALVREKPWVYSLYKTPSNCYQIKVVYSPKSFVDAHMVIELSVEEVSMFEKDEKWADKFAEAVRRAPDKYMARHINASTACGTAKA